MPIKDLDKRREYHRNHYAKRKELAISLLGGKCSSCGSVDNLEFHHALDTGTKVKVTTLLRWAWSDVVDELTGCVLLCAFCHQEESLGRAGLARATHGTYTMYCGHGCRCAECRAANANHTAEYRKAHPRKQCSRKPDREERCLP